ACCVAQRQWLEHRHEGRSRSRTGVLLMKEWSRFQYAKSLGNSLVHDFFSGSIRTCLVWIVASVLSPNDLKRENRCLGLGRIAPMHHPNARFSELSIELELGPRARSRRSRCGDGSLSHFLPSRRWRGHSLPVRAGRMAWRGSASWVLNVVLKSFGKECVTWAMSKDAILLSSIGRAIQRIGCPASLPSLSR